MTLEPRLRVLLVEDNPLDTRMVIRALETSTDAAYEVVHVGDLENALDRGSQEAFDCILLDLSLPDSEGLVPVELLSARSPQCPVVVLTGLDDPEVAIEAVQRGAQDYLIKSTITPELIERAIRYSIARHHSDTQLDWATDLIEIMNDRERIARDLHDTVIQRLFAIGMGLQAASQRDELDDLQRHSVAAVGEIDEAIRELREAIFGLNTLDENFSLATDIGRTVDAEYTVLGFTPNVRIGAIDSLPGELHYAVVAVVREALANVARHAAATVADVTIQTEDDHLVVRVVDNGKGIDIATGSTPLSGGEGQTGLGLKNLATRAVELGGSFAIEPAPAGGTCLEWTVPLTQA